MPVIDQTNITELQVRRVWRARPADNYAWWFSVVHEVPDACSITADAVNEISRRHHGADVDVVTDPNGAEIVAWLRKKRPGELMAGGEP